jgi:hypothetical protein
LHVLQRINIMVSIDLAFEYAYLAFKVLDPVDDDGPG